MFRFAPANMKCNYCPGICIKKGYYKNVQRYLCKKCRKYQQAEYSYQKYDSTIEKQVTLLNNEGMGINSISRILSIPKTSILRLLLRASFKINQPVPIEQGQEYEVDELHTYVGRNHSSCYTYIIYAINRATRKIIDCVIGARSKENIGKLVNRLKTLSPKRIFTDKLNIFGRLIPRSIHRTFLYRTNRIERKNLTLRTHLKRLSRKTICYSKSFRMLEASLKLYCWELRRPVLQD